MNYGSGWRKDVVNQYLEYDDDHDEGFCQRPDMTS